MPNFLETIFAQLKRASGRVVLSEIHGDLFVSVTGRELLDQLQLVRSFLRRSGLQPGERCALLAPNSTRWAAFHLALMAEGVIVVPLYSRQAPVELAGMMKDCQPRLIFVNDAAFGERSEEHTSELQSRLHLVCRLLLEKKKQQNVVDGCWNLCAAAIAPWIYGCFALAFGYLDRQRSCVKHNAQRAIFIHDFYVPVQ